MSTTPSKKAFFSENGCSRQNAVLDRFAGVKLIETVDFHGPGEQRHE
jgi:hypothetical protein